MSEKKDLTGLIFGRLLVIRPGEKKGHNYSWICQCSCGNTKSIRGSALRSGESLSCGCLKELGIPWQTIYSRLRYGWTVERALTT